MSDAQKTAETFERWMAFFCDQWKRTLSPGTVRQYFEVIEGFKPDEVDEIFRRIRDAEKMFPVVATLRAYAASITRTAKRVVPEYRPPRFTAEERADIERMKSEMRQAFRSTPWSAEIPEWMR